MVQLTVGPLEFHYTMTLGVDLDSGFWVFGESLYV
jgi:hypothetical protein